MSKNGFLFERANDSPGFSLWQVSTLWQRRINTGLRPFDLTHAQFVLLASLTWLVSDDKSLTQAELASHAKMDVMMVSNVLRTLEEKGLIARTPHPMDTRAKSLTVTHKGRELASQVVHVVESIDREFFSQLEDKVGEFNDLLQKLILKNQSEH